jgi:hypothetical protein
VKHDGARPNPFGHADRQIVAILLLIKFVDELINDDGQKVTLHMGAIFYVYVDIRRQFNPSYDCVILLNTQHRFLSTFMPICYEWFACSINNNFFILLDLITVRAKFFVSRRRLTS